MKTLRALHECARPFEDSYWVLPERLLVGAVPGIRGDEFTRGRLSNLSKAGIRTIVNLTESDEKDHTGVTFHDYSAFLPELDIQMHRFPIPDMDIPSPITMARILSLIDREHLIGKAVYVHCWGGLGRTGTVVGCFLLKRKLATVSTVFKLIVSLKSKSSLSAYDSPQTEGQREFVREWY